MSRMFQIMSLLVGVSLLSGIGCARGPFAPANAAPGGGVAQGAGPWGAPPAANALPGAVPGAAPGAVPPAGVPPTVVVPGQGAGGFPTVPPLPPAGGGGVSGVAPPAVQPNAAAAPASTSLPNNWSNPGTIAQQQQQAQRFDPYADNNAGPEIVGGRPREFQKPLADPVRAKGFRDQRWPF